MPLFCAQAPWLEAEGSARPALSSLVSRMAAWLGSVSLLLTDGGQSVVLVTPSYVQDHWILYSETELPGLHM